jgi:hypothetical protein
MAFVCPRNLSRIIRVVVATTVSTSLTAAAAHAQAAVSLPDTGLSTTLTAVVADQAAVSLPGAVAFAVTNVNGSTAVTNQEVTISNIVLATATTQVKLSLQANAATFASPAGAPATYDASDISWSYTGGGSPWTNGTASDGTLSSAAFNTVATCAAGVTSCSTTRLKFTLAPKAAITRSGLYTLTVTWKIESIGT